MTKYRAEYTVLVTVEFEDNGTDSLLDQASDTLNDAAASALLEDADFAIIGEPEKIEDQIEPEEAP